MHYSTTTKEPQMIAKTIEQLNTMKARKFRAEDFLYSYNKPNAITGKTSRLNVVTCPNCEKEHFCLIGIEEGPIECECGNNIYITKEVIYCDESGINEEEKP